jgi:hypothetical protein
LRNELIRLHQIRLSLATLHKLLRRHSESRLAERRWRRRVPQRYNRPIPGDRVQMDVCKIAPGLYHYVAVDDCTRYRVLGLFPRRRSSTRQRTCRPRTCPISSRSGNTRTRGPAPFVARWQDTH